jgi:hypothetical protein
MFYCYLYRDPSRNNEPIYVGKGKGQRAFVHLKRRDVHPFTQRLQMMAKNAVKPVIEFLVKDCDEELALLCEVEAIDKFGRKDLGKGTLLNLTDGGEDVINLSVTTRQRMSSIAKSRENLPETKKVRSDAAFERWQNPDFKKATSEKMRLGALKRWANTRKSKDTQ